VQFSQNVALWYSFPFTQDHGSRKPNPSVLTLNSAARDDFNSGTRVHAAR
jgi:hypothetical protein